jgi:hypothetical protein
MMSNRLGQVGNGIHKRYRPQEVLELIFLLDPVRDVCPPAETGKPFFDFIFG